MVQLGRISAMPWASSGGVFTLETLLVAVVGLEQLLQGVSSAPEATQKWGDGAGLSLGHQQGQIVVWHQGGLFIGPRLITRVKPSVQPESARDLETNMSCYEFGFGCGFRDNFLL
jgi:hypothetical protein